MNNFRKYRELSGMKVVQAAKKLGITVVYLCYIENGSRKPGRDLIIRMCNLYNCNPSDLFFGQ